MVATKAEIRSGTYYDSVVLMQLQRMLAAMPHIVEAGVVMGTPANKELLAQTGLLTPETKAADTSDLIIVVQAEEIAAAEAVLQQVDQFLAQRRTTAEHGYLPKSLESAARMLPEAGWVLVSVAGRYAADLARDALRLEKHVFLYSDNVSLDDEVTLKHIAAHSRLLVMGPDCGTAIINGVGLGFANRVRQGPIGLVAGSGTGLQQVSVRIHQLGSGISQALGTGGRDLSNAVGGTTTRQGLDLLMRDPETGVIVLVSKPPAREMADEILNLARSSDKPVVVDFIGYAASARQVDNLYFASTLDEAAEWAVRLAGQPAEEEGRKAQGRPTAAIVDRFAPGQRYLRGLFSGGTLAQEAQLLLQHYVTNLYSNVAPDEAYRLPNPTVSQAHTIVDMGEDALTVGRLHPMIDNDLRIRRLYQEARDPEVAVILLDLVLGYGAHPNPAEELGPAIAHARSEAQEAGRYLEILVVVVGTDEDPQEMAAQIWEVERAGARVETSITAAVQYIGHLLQSLNPQESARTTRPVDMSVLRQPLGAINVGLEQFAESLRAQGAPVIQIDWRPPASGDERLMAILKRMREA